MPENLDLAELERLRGEREKLAAALVDAMALPGGSVVQTGTYNTFMRERHAEALEIAERLRKEIKPYE